MFRCSWLVPTETCFFTTGLPAAGRAEHPDARRTSAEFLAPHVTHGRKRPQSVLATRSGASAGDTSTTSLHDVASKPLDDAIAERLVTAVTPLTIELALDGREKMSKQVVRGGDVAGLLERFARLREKARARTGKAFPVVVIQEAGLDGFWIDRALQNEGIESHVVDPASIATSRRRRRAKTDGIDGEALGRALLAYKRGEPRGCDGESADPRGRGPPPPLSRAQGADRRAGPACQSRQGAAVLTGDIWLRAAAPRPATTAGYAPDRPVSSASL